MDSHKGDPRRLGRFVVVDLRAGPVQYGSVHGGPGALRAPPLLADPTAFLPRFSAVVLSAVRHIFVPDVTRCDVDPPLHVCLVLSFFSVSLSVCMCLCR